MSEDEQQGRSLVQRIGLVLGPLCAFLFWILPKLGYFIDPEHPLLNAMAAVTCWMAIWWMTEAIPIAATSLLPIVLFPLFKIPPGNNITETYGSPMIFLFLGGFLVALAIEDSGLHRRVALLIIEMVGDNPRRLVLGFMIATAFLSMWISNTATTMMLLPIALSVVSQVEQQTTDGKTSHRFAIAMMLGLAYAASIGGVATVIGTPPNVAFQATFDKLHPDLPQISFFRWMLLGVPYSIVFLLIAWVLLTRVLQPLPSTPFIGGRDVIREKLMALGPMTTPERRMLVVFLTTALLWITREPISGWGWAPKLGIAVGYFPEKTKLATDATVAIMMGILCFVIPCGTSERRSLLQWKSTTRIPWGILLLFGGGLALAKGMSETELASYLGEMVASHLRELSSAGTVVVVAGSMTLLTELTSNLASTQMVLPILSETAKSLQLNPLALMLPATLAASSAFMLPVATPPNAIVFGSGKLRLADMMKAGIVLNVVGVVLVLIFVSLFQSFL